MPDTKRNEAPFIGYEYRDVTVRRRMVSLYADSYTSFGWTLDGTTLTLGGIDSVVMKFKRDRSMRNKAELARLQRQFDACVGDILALENQKGFTASAAAYAIGVVGTVCMVGAVLAYLTGMTPLTAVLAVPGVAGWVVPYLCYVTLRRNKTAEVEPLIDGKYDEIYALCEQANAMLTS